MIITPTERLTNAEYMGEFNELLEDSGIEEMTWHVEKREFHEFWTAEVQMPGSERPAIYDIVFNSALLDPARIYYKSPWSPPERARQKIGTVATVPLAILCAEDHYRRTVQYRRGSESG